MNTLDILTAHYQQLRGQSFEIAGVKAKGGKTLRLYHDPVTQDDLARIKERAGPKATNAQHTLYTVICLAKDENGKPAFEDNAESIQALQANVPAEIIAEIAQKVMRVSRPEDLGKP